MNKNLSLIATLVPLIIVAIGLVGWVLSLRSDVTDTVGQLEAVQAEVEDAQFRLNELEKSLAIADDQMKTIMGDHMGFADTLREIGEAGALPSGERRAYGGYNKGVSETNDIRFLRYYHYPRQYPWWLILGWIQSLRG